MAEIKDISMSNFDSDVLEAQGLLMVYYYAPWCKPANEMTEVVDSVADEVVEKMAVAQVNTDQEGEIVKQQQIRVLPCVQVFKDGQLITTLRGSQSKLELLGQLSGIITREDEGEAKEDEGDAEDKEKSEGEE